MKHTTKFFAGSILLLSIANVSAADLAVGANIGNVPWEFQDASGEFVGFEIDLVREVGARLNRSIEIVNIPFNGLFSAVQSGRIDIALSSITITDKRLASVAFVQPYYDSAAIVDRLSQEFRNQPRGYARQGHRRRHWLDRR